MDNFFKEASHVEPGLSSQQTQSYNNKLCLTILCKVYLLSAGSKVLLCQTEKDFKTGNYNN